jgi:hypothetical protein
MGVQPFKKFSQVTINIYTEREKKFFQNVPLITQGLSSLSVFSAFWVTVSKSTKVSSQSCCTRQLDTQGSRGAAAAQLLKQTRQSSLVATVFEIAIARYAQRIAKGIFVIAIMMWI